MSAAAIRLMEQFLAALNQSDWTAALELLAEDAVLDPPSGERQIGREQFRWWLAEGRRAGRESLSDIALMTTEDGTRGAAEFTLRRETGDAPRISVNAGMFFAISGGRIERVTCCNFPQ